MCVDVCGCVWMCVDVCGCVWMCVDVCGCVWMCVDVWMCGCVDVWMCRCVYGTHQSGPHSGVKNRISGTTTVHFHIITFSVFGPRRGREGGKG